MEQIARAHQVWVITREANRAAIEAALAVNPLPNAHFVYFDLPRWLRFWKNGRRGLYPYYYLWQLGGYFLARRLHRGIGFDLVHHITFVTYWMPSFLALLPIPFLWGPVGGGESAPPGFSRVFSWRGRIHEAMRDLVRGLARFDPFVRLTAARCQWALATTPATELRLRQLGCRHTEVFPVVGLRSEEIARIGGLRGPRSRPLRFASAGDLLHWKGCELALRALARLDDGTRAWEYWIIGKGPEKTRLRRIAAELHLDQRVLFWGALPRGEVLEKLSQCDVLLHPSLHDSGAWIAVEAMAAGCAVLCLDLGGPGLHVTSESGIKIPARDAGQVVAELSAALSSWIENPEQCARLGENGRRRAAAQFTWERKGGRMLEIYSRICPARAN